jgi:mRNA-degrading endonuclease RelE of RelBE toxin-antitoxin system
MWIIEWSAKSRDQFRKIDKAEQQKIISSLDECAEDPFRFTKKLRELY